jgi:hypothetical protein
MHAAAKELDCAFHVKVLEFKFIVLFGSFVIFYRFSFCKIWISSTNLCISKVNVPL